MDDCFLSHDKSHLFRLLFPFIWFSYAYFRWHSPFWGFCSVFALPNSKTGVCEEKLKEKNQLMIINLLDGRDLYRASFCDKIDILQDRKDE